MICANMLESLEKIYLLKNKDSNLKDLAALIIWKDSGWTEMADLIDKISNRAEIETLFLGKKVETSKKMLVKCTPWQLHDRSVDKSM